MQRTVGGLQPGTVYRYRFSQRDLASPIGFFRTAPAPEAAAEVRFAITGDADATPGPNGKPTFNGFETYRAMARARNDFNVNFGDTIYSDSEVGRAPVARTVAQKRAKYLLGLALAPLRQLRLSTATFKVVVNPEPLMQLYALPYDRWEGYAADWARVLDALQAVRNVVVLTTDKHAHLIGEIGRETFGAQGPQGTGIREVVTRPVATNTYAKEIDSFLGTPGFGAVVTGAFFKPEPPRGLGLRCAQTDQYGYAQVTVTRAALTVQPRTASGGIVLDTSGAPCAPLVVRAS